MAKVTYTLDPNNLPKTPKKDLDRYDALKEEEIDYSDIPELGDEFFARAKRASEFEATKKRITIRLDSDVLEWLKSQGRGYQTRANMILRAAMEHQTP